MRLDLADILNLAKESESKGSEATVRPKENLVKAKPPAPEFMQIQGQFDPSIHKQFLLALENDTTKRAMLAEALNALNALFKSYGKPQIAE